MKLIGLAGILALSSLACQHKEETAAAKPAGSAPAESGAPAVSAVEEEKGAAAASKPGKVSERPEVAEKKPPVAEPVAVKPGFVKSPFNGKLIDVGGIPAGSLVADPTFPASAKKYFRVPDMGPEQEEVARLKTAEEAVRRNGPVAKPVPGKQGFFFSPYDNKIIDATGINPGDVIKDPGSPEGETRFFKLPDEPNEVKEEP
ncbi:hypothetical protein [Luteolibacter soli]|uniref:Lipoprotein n=1 Tax=Luteolibacter soli TaxID=3135280 RepID=A0ABU9APU1_9BACT